MVLVVKIGLVVMSVGLPSISAAWLAEFVQNRRLPKNIDAAAFSPDSEIVAPATDGGTVVLFDPSTEKRLGVLQ